MGTALKGATPLYTYKYTYIQHTKRCTCAHTHTYAQIYMEMHMERAVLHVQPYALSSRQFAVISLEDYDFDFGKSVRR